MSDSAKRPTWMDDALVKDISPKKLAFLEKMFQEAHGKSQKELLSFLMPMMKQAKQENLTFTPAEMNAAIAAIRKYSTEEERAKMDDVLAKAQAKNGGK